MHQDTDNKNMLDQEHGIREFSQPSQSGTDCFGLFAYTSEIGKAQEHGDSREDGPEQAQPGIERDVETQQDEHYERTDPAGLITSEERRELGDEHPQIEYGDAGPEILEGVAGKERHKGNKPSYGKENSRRRIGEVFQEPKQDGEDEVTSDESTDKPLANEIEVGPVERDIAVYSEQGVNEAIRRNALPPARAMPDKILSGNQQVADIEDGEDGQPALLEEQLPIEMRGIGSRQTSA